MVTYQKYQCEICFLMFQIPLITYFKIEFLELHNVSVEICHQTATTFKNLKSVSLVDFTYSLNCNPKNFKSPTIFVENLVELVEPFVEHSKKLRKIHVDFGASKEFALWRQMFLAHEKIRRWSLRVRFSVECDKWRHRWFCEKIWLRVYNFGQSNGWMFIFEYFQFVLLFRFFANFLYFLHCVA